MSSSHQHQVSFFLFYAKFIIRHLINIWVHSFIFEGTNLFFVVVWSISSKKREEICSSNGNQIFKTLVRHIEAEIKTEGIRFDICQILQNCRNFPSASLQAKASRKKRRWSICIKFGISYQNDVQSWNHTAEKAKSMQLRFCPSLLFRLGGHIICFFN